MGLLDIFKRKKDNKNEYERLNDICNAAFESAFNKCRLDFGREMVTIVDIKSKLLDSLNSAKSVAPAQELLAKKLLELVSVYFRMAEIYISAKRDEHLSETRLQEVDDLKDKIQRAYSLINSLNTQYYLSYSELSDMSSYDEIINEAVALRNVIDKNNYVKN